jgi:hypothetical protein|tara:strand:+ start:315 stop:473 length:159 start_codon:yes stop_codon:yes gene_type:complete
MSESKKDPRYFQTQSIDNFFGKPEEIIKFANSLEYQIGHMDCGQEKEPKDYT